MEIIGICGRKGSGKSTLANHIAGFRLPFAQPLKDMLAVIGIPEEYLYAPEFKEVPHFLLQNKTARHAMVTLGTEWGRKQIGTNLWTTLWKYNVINRKPGATIVVDDVRFIEEVQAILDMGGQLVAVERPNQPKPRWWKRTDASESLDYRGLGIPVLLNDGTPGQLLEKFNAIYKRGT